MRISQDWLNQYVDTPPEEELEHVFEMAGIGVEERENGQFTLEITSNRGDWLGAFGLAREVAAMTGNRLRLPVIEEAAPVTAKSLKVEMENAADCTRYHATLLENIKIAESPQWLQKRLIAGGMRPQNNVVDITNYVMLEMGQPLHAFDADSIATSTGGHHIVVRRARIGESIITLDGLEHQLSHDVLCICNHKEPVAVAGLMGGASSEVKDHTAKVLLESAHFAPAAVRSSGRTLNFGTEASRRFERWVDPAATARAAARATQLLCELAGANVVESIDVNAAPWHAEMVEIRLARTNAMLGLKLDLPTLSALLERLRLKVLLKDNATLVVETPSWRNDISREVDLIEEVARVHGYDKIPQTLPTGANVAAGRSLVQRLEEKARSLLLRSGLQEVVTYSLENAEKVAKAGLIENGLLASPPLQLRNPLSEDYTQLRTSMLPSLLGVLQKNAGNDPKAEAARIFELARVYLPKNGGLPDERRRVGIALSAAVPLAHWQKGSAATDFFSLKAIVNNFLEGLGAHYAEYRTASNQQFHPGRCASITLEGEDIGVLGEIHPTIQENWDLPQRAYVALLDFDALVRHLTLRRVYQPIPKYPPVDRDLAILLDESISAARVNAVIKKAAGDLLERLDVFDLYTGPPVPEGKKSMALSLRFRDPLRTLNDGMVDELIENIVGALEHECGAQLRK